VRYLSLCAVMVSALAVGPGAAGGASAVACKTGLTGTFKVVPGSAGAGNIVYKLRVKNGSGSTCAFPRRPSLRLLDVHGHALPTHATFPISPVAPLQIAAGKSAVTTARFSPDIPSGGEPQSGPCEKAAHKLRVGLIGGASVTVPVLPATQVCGRGSMQFKAIHQGS
jgi:hypothetical protein